MTVNYLSADKFNDERLISRGSSRSRAYIRANQSLAGNYLPRSLSTARDPRDGSYVFVNFIKGIPVYVTISTSHQSKRKIFFALIKKKRYFRICFVQCTIFFAI